MKYINFRFFIEFEQNSEFFHALLRDIGKFFNFFCISRKKKFFLFLSLIFFWICLELISFDCLDYYVDLFNFLSFFCVNYLFDS